MLMTVEKAAKSLQIHEQTLYKWIKRGKVKVIRLSPKCIRIDDSEIARIVELGKRIPKAK